MIDNIKKIAISGGNGKMGNLLSEHIKSKDSFEVSGIYDPIACLLYTSDAADE